MLFWILLGVVLVAIFGGAAIAAAWWLIYYAIVGLVIGGLARLLVSSSEGLGAAGTILAGLTGSILGGLIARAFELGTIVELLVSIVVAAVVVAIATGSSRRD
jgi:uncharacterized membrane protein YeaQ/YmgE (transglycosylase-associated protein family)